SAETIIAAKNKDKAEIAWEVSDLIYHIMVMLAQCDMTLEDIYEELAKRR
ncbi:MAG: phosphoribosyl-ATP diphosphatase, partial [Clostridiaceae bacterium]|nr:phosphoribosyl-ATP diphosphatase [Clostridiaceae bacterium]